MGMVAASWIPRHLVEHFLIALIINLLCIRICIWLRPSVGSYHAQASIRIHFHWRVESTRSPILWNVFTSNTYFISSTCRSKRREASVLLELDFLFSRAFSSWGLSIWSVAAAALSPSFSWHSNLLPRMLQLTPRPLECEWNPADDGPNGGLPMGLL